MSERGGGVKKKLNCEQGIKVPTQMEEGSML